jgi:hypothetical protein
MGGIASLEWGYRSSCDRLGESHSAEKPAVVFFQRSHPVTWARGGAASGVVSWFTCGAVDRNWLKPLQFRFCPPSMAAGDQKITTEEYWSCTQLLLQAVSNTA